MNEKKTKKPIYCWDSSVLLAVLKNEPRSNEEISGLNIVLSEIDKQEAKVIFSAILKIEVLECEMDSSETNMFDKAMQRSNIQEISTSKIITDLARKIRDYYQQQSRIDGKKTLSVADCVHLATAIHYSADEFHTYDEGKKSNDRGLLGLNGNVAGHFLRICKPGFSHLNAEIQLPIPLL